MSEASFVFVDFKVAKKKYDWKKQIKTKDFLSIKEYCKVYKIEVDYWKKHRFG
jgi:hypothetical protein